METKKKGFYELVKDSEVPVLVDFYADWCGPCKAMAPVLKNLAISMKGKVKVLKIDVDKNEAVSMKYKIQAIPTLLLFHKGEIVWRQAGAVPASQLESVIQAHTS